MAEASRMFANLFESKISAARNAAAAVIKANPPCATPDCVATEAKARSMGIFGRLMGPSAYNIYYNTTGQAFGILFSISLAMFIVFLMLFFVNATLYPIFSFSPNQPGLVSIPTASDQQIVFTKGPAVFDVSANFIKMPACTYTIGQDVHLSGNFMLAQIPRVILYRSEDPVHSMDTLSDITDSTSDAEGLEIMNSYLLNHYPDTNIIAWLDPVKNDLYVSVITLDSSSGSTDRSIQTTSAIENVPIKKSFRLAIVFTGNFVEVYINGKLEESMPIKNPLVTIPSTSNVFATVKSMQQNVLTGNVSMWPRVLTAREIAANEAAPRAVSTFFPIT